MNLEHCPKLLAPAGDISCFLAALNAGADAVYLGLQRFNARARATNFSIESLQEYLPLAHTFGMKVLITLNTILRDSEMGDVIRDLCALERLGVDGVIVQDYGVAHLITSHFPSLRLHASTQMALHNVEGVAWAQRQGFRRVVLARELSLDEIAEIRHAFSPAEMEIEVFCHGSLCYSYSGLCFFGGMEIGRSGNRGECIYPCRQSFAANEKPDQMIFNMKDLDSSSCLTALVQTGVDVLKIEGRKKDAQYVASILKKYRMGLDRCFGERTVRNSCPPEAVRFLYQEPQDESSSFGFQRETSTLFLQGRDAPIAIDRDNPTHRGVRAGQVLLVGPKTMRFRTEIPLERFDQLRFDLPTEGRPGSAEKIHLFSIREMSVGKNRVPTCAAGLVVDVVIPDDIPMPKTGILIYKLRSSDLKRRIDALLNVPQGYRLRALTPVTIRIGTTQHLDSVSLSAALFEQGQLLREVSLEYPQQQSNGGSSFEREVQEQFGILGNAALIAEHIEIEGDRTLFFPRSVLKELKRKLTDGIAELRASRFEQRCQEAQALLESPASVKSDAEPLCFSWKCDDPAVVQMLAVELQQLNDCQHEILFEPKISWLESTSDLSTALQVLKELVEPAHHFGISLPVIVRAWDKGSIERLVDATKTLQLSRIELNNPAGFTFLAKNPAPLAQISTGFSMHCRNQQAALSLGAQEVTVTTLSIEISRTEVVKVLNNWPKMVAPKPMVYIYGRIPLYLSENCPFFGEEGCHKAKNRCESRLLSIKNSDGKNYVVELDLCRVTVAAEQPFCRFENLQELRAAGAGFFRIDLGLQKLQPADVTRVVSQLRQQGRIAVSDQ